MKNESTDSYVCADCGLHYEDEKRAQECYEYCVKNNACSVEITQYSIERRQSEA